MSSFDDDGFPPIVNTRFFDQSVMVGGVRIIGRLLERRTWRAAFKGTPAFLKSLKAWRDHDDATALRWFEEFLEVHQNPAAEYMAFYATLFVLNGRSEDAKRVFAEVINGSYSPLRWPSRSQYAVAFSHYFLALMQGRDDVVEWWLVAKRQRPKRGFCSTYLLLGNGPLPPQYAQG